MGKACGWRWLRPLAAPLTTLNTETAVEQLKPIVTKYNIEK